MPPPSQGTTQYSFHLSEVRKVDHVACQDSNPGPLGSESSTLPPLHTTFRVPGNDFEWAGIEERLRRETFEAETLLYKFRTGCTRFVPSQGRSRGDYCITGGRYERDQGQASAISLSLSTHPSVRINAEGRGTIQPSLR
ncbi:hypothetical protein Bbelb_134740 [Branchiostoma belcheri]|nr:hypothetical protein Bbelb_134740 [Branchiostoma belcheri]